MTALKTVDAVRGVKVGGGKNVFPNAGTILIRGYADAQNTSLESYAKAHNIKFQLKELNILCIGNSHTDDYTTYMQSILNDVLIAMRPTILMRAAFRMLWIRSMIPLQRVNMM